MDCIHHPGDGRVCWICETPPPAEHGTWVMPDAQDAATKHDGDKLPMDLFPPEALEEITKALAFGAKKYARNQWRKGMAWSRYYAALLRHLNAWNAGYDNDSESGLSHLAHAGCCLVFLIASAKSNLGEDDRWRPG